VFPEQSVCHALHEMSYFHCHTHSKLCGEVINSIWICTHYMLPGQKDMATMVHMGHTSRYKYCTGFSEYYLKPLPPVDRTDHRGYPGRNDMSMDSRNL
jgi:hypothetical protein